MMRNYLTFDFGNSFFRDRRVVDLIKDKLPVSISIGLWTTLITYLVSIPLGIRKAVRDGSRFDVWTSAVIIVGYAVPSFLSAVLLIVLFAGGSYLSIFPLRGQRQLGLTVLADAHCRLFLAHHLADHGTGDLGRRHLDDADQELLSRGNQQAVRLDGTRQGPQRAPGALWPRLQECYAARRRRFSGGADRHSVHRIIIDRGDFSLDGLGLIGFEAAINCDHPIRFGTFYVFTLIGLLLKLISDLTDMVWGWAGDHIGRR